MTDIGIGNAHLQKAQLLGTGIKPCAQGSPLGVQFLRKCVRMHGQFRIHSKSNPNKGTDTLG